jgi:Tol biopolymer transport system component
LTFRAKAIITVPSDGSAPSNDTGGGGCGFQTGSCQALGQAPSISGDGRYVAFQSDLTNLVPGDTNGVMDVFFRDMCLGAAAGCVPTTVRIAAAADSPSMSKDARFIFYRGSSAGIHAYDTCLGQGAGCVSSDVVVSIDETGTTVGVGYGLYRISPDGRYLAFGNHVRDTCLGVATACTPTTVQLPGIVLVDSVAPDGAHVAVTTTATLGDPADTNGLADVYVMKTCLGSSGSCTQAAKRVSVDAQGIQVGGSSATFSPDGQRLIYNQNFQGVVITPPLALP